MSDRPSTGIVAFINARLDELEADAQDAYYDGQAWVPEEEAVVAADRDLEPILFLDRKRDARHASNWSPAYVLADIAAKRAILESFKYEDGEGYVVDFWLARPEFTPPAEAHVMIRVARLLAAPYREHPDFDPDWSVSDE